MFGLLPTSIRLALAVNIIPVLDFFDVSDVKTELALLMRDVAVI